MGTSIYPTARKGLYFFISIFVKIGLIGMSCEAKCHNFVFIMADDLGWNDVSYHGSDQVMTPNIDLFAYSGIALNRYYSHAICTPSRAAFLTGRYSYKTGMQGYPPIIMGEDRGIPTNLRLLPEYLKDAGYATHLVGKWHVGSSRKEYLPTRRGFDSAFGHRTGFCDYYTYVYEELWGTYQVSGLALFRDQTPQWEAEGYITDIYTKEAKSVIENHDTQAPLFLFLAHNAPHSANPGALLQAPPEEVRKKGYIESPERRIFAAMMKILDDSVGDIAEALFYKGILEDTTIVFVSDNGGMTIGDHLNYASNYPLRGIKATPYEGGVRVVGLVWSTRLNNTSHYWDGYMHVTDWLPTLLRAAGLEPPTDIDGIDQWDRISSNLPSLRKQMIEIDDIVGYASIIDGDYKLVTGTVTQGYGTYHGSNLTGLIGSPPSYVEALKRSKVYGVLESIGMTYTTEEFSRIRNKSTIKCDTSSASTCNPGIDRVCLYNIKDDPCETKELSLSNPCLVSLMQSRLMVEVASRIPRNPPIINPLAAPSRHNYTWDVFIN